MTKPTLDELKAEYTQLLHGMQTGVAYLMEFNPAEVAPKHLRVGINSALCSVGSMITLLVEKGVITEEEYFTKMIQALKEDIESYQQKLSEHYGGANITLL